MPNTEALPGWLTALESETRAQARAELNALGEMNRAGSTTGEGQQGTSGATAMARGQRKERRCKRRRIAAISLARRSPTFAGFLKPIFGNQRHRKVAWPRNDGSETSTDGTPHLISSTQQAPRAAWQVTSTEAAPKLRADDTASKPQPLDQQKSELNRPQLLSDVRPLPTDRPFDIPSADHCETPSLAYAHVGPILRHIASQLSPALSPAEACASLKIWDPYFCSGTVIDRLGAIGFPQVHNVNEDFYATIADPTGTQLPDYDVLVTNPPFSGDHLNRILRYVLSPLHKGRPYLLLMPNYVCLKPFYRRAITAAAYTARQQQSKQGSHIPEEPMLLAPPIRYAFDDRGQRDGNTTNQPYPCLWYISSGRVQSNNDVLHWWKGLSMHHKSPMSQRPCVLAARPAHLPPSALEGTNWVDPSNRAASRGGARAGGGRGRGGGRRRGR